MKVRLLKTVMVEIEIPGSPWKPGDFLTEDEWYENMEKICHIRAQDLTLNWKIVPRDQEICIDPFPPNTTDVEWEVIDDS